MSLNSDENVGSKPEKDSKENLLNSCIDENLPISSNLSGPDPNKKSLAISLNKDLPIPTSDNDSTEDMVSDSLLHEEPLICSNNLYDGTGTTEEKGTNNERSQSGGSNLLFNSKNNRPNFFVGFQISNPKIHDKIKHVQSNMVQAEPRIEGALIDVATLHITLFVLKIRDAETLHRVSSALDHCGALLMESFSKDPLTLTFQGLSNFNQKVLFAKIRNDDQYHRLIDTANEIKRKFIEDFGIFLPEAKRKLNPHLTIANLSKLDDYAMGTKKLYKIDRRIYSSFSNMDFGTQVVQGLQLLSMSENKDKYRYYYSVRHIKFDVPLIEETDHSKCCFPPLQPAESEVVAHST